MSLSITVLGCSGTYAGPGGACSGYLVRSPTTAIWLDCGPGTLGNLQTHLPLAELDGVVCSHSHPDHWTELPVLANALRYGLRTPTAGLPVFWTAATAELFAAVSSHPPAPAFDPSVVHDGSTAQIGDISMAFARTDHPVETLAVRLDHDGASLAYSADTGDAWDLRSLGAGIDLAVIEATLDEAEAGVVQHLTARQAATKASEAAVASLVLTHLAPGSDPDRRMTDAAEVFDGPIAVAEVGQIHHA